MAAISRRPPVATSELGQREHAMENAVRPPMVPSLVRACRPRGNYSNITRNDDSLCMLPPKAVVLYDFQPQTEREVAVLVGDMVDCIAVDTDRKWLYVRTLRNTAGYVPAAYCRFLAVVPQQQSQPSRTHGPAVDPPYASLDRRVLRRMPSALLPSPNAIATSNQPVAAPNPGGFGTSVAVPPPITLPDRAETTLSPCSFASTSSGISTGGTDSQNDSRSEQTDDFCSFNRAAVAQYGSASGSSSCSSACERRIKMLKTNGQKKIQRTKSAELLAEPSNSSTQTLNAGSDKMIDILWSQTLRKHSNAVDTGRPVAVRALHTNPTVKSELAKQSSPNNSGNAPEKVVCETFV